MEKIQYFGERMLNSDVWKSRFTFPMMSRSAFPSAVATYHAVPLKRLLCKAIASTH